MITIKARINLSESNGSISDVTSNINGNNISANISDVIGKRNVVVSNPFILGRSKLGSGASFAKRVLYFMGRQLSNSSGAFVNPYTITVNGSNITSIIISFDTINNGYPKSIVVDGVSQSIDDDPTYSLVLDSANSHTITISNWNKPNSPLIITSIYADINIEIDRDNLLSFESDILDRSNVQEPTYGVISNSARISFSDLDEQVLDLISQKILHEGLGIEVKLDNDIANVNEQVCLMYIQSLSYDNDNRQVNLSLKDRLEMWQDINVDAIDYTPTVSSSQTAQWFYEKFYSITKSNGYDILAFNELDSDTKSVLSNTDIEYPMLESSNLWEAWDKLCKLCLLHIWQNNEGKIIVKYNI